MRLNIRETGSGDRLAVLIHGFNCDAGDWWEFAPLLVDAGYRVQAVDLRGHGHSPRAESYRLEEFAADLVETIAPSRPDVVIGHSLGARVLGLAVAELHPRRAIYLDPPWSPLDDEDRAGLFPDLESVIRMSDQELAATLRADFPRWSDRAIDVDVESWRLWDPRSAEWIDQSTVASVPSAAVVPSLLVVADPSPVCRRPEQQLAAQRGFELRIATGLSHSLFRDDLDTLVSVLHGWV